MFALMGEANGRSEYSQRRGKMNQVKLNAPVPKPLLDMGESLKYNLKGGYINVALILVYSYLDAMASLTMPENQSSVKSKDFIYWANKYMKTDADQPYQYDARDLYGARCGLVHQYSPYSDLSDAGHCKLFVYSTYPDHKYDPGSDSALVVISAPRLIQDFFKAMSMFIKDLLSD
jgi:hypothetical protein